MIWIRFFRIRLYSKMFLVFSDGAVELNGVNVCQKQIGSSNRFMPCGTVHAMAQWLLYVCILHSVFARKREEKQIDSKHFTAEKPINLHWWQSNVTIGADSFVMVSTNTFWNTKRKQILFPLWTLNAKRRLQYNKT